MAAAMASCRLCRRLLHFNCKLHRHGLQCLALGTVRHKHIPVDERITDLWDKYHRTKEVVQAVDPQPDQEPTAIFANNELDLKHIDVYGFDYDYTLANYKDSLRFLIYNLGREALIKNHKYPKAIQDLPYDPSFAVRGLHVDIQKGLILKIDAFHNIQLGTVYRGLRPVSDSETLQMYNGSHVGLESLNDFYGKGRGGNMAQLVDLFALPEMTLFANVIEYFMSNGIAYDAEYVFYDVKMAVQGIHSTGILHNAIMRNLERYLEKGQNVAELLYRLSAAGKKLFLVTNSSVPFVDRGMSYLVGPNWNELFDVIVTNARKPKFFYETTRPFRRYDRELGVRSWDRVTEVNKGQFYEEGNFYQLQQMTGWYGPSVLYFGDHVYSDLADATLKHGWRTGAIIPELEDEINIMNTKVYKRCSRWLVALQGLIQKSQVNDDPESLKVLQEWKKERNELRKIAKDMFNPQFGSLFRTYHNPTYFTRRLNRFCDVYMSEITNLLHYPLYYTYYPRRFALPHEAII